MCRPTHEAWPLARVLSLVLTKMGRTGPPLEPHRRLQEGKSGDPHSQNADISPRAQGTLGLGLAEKRKGKCGAPRAPSACGLGRRVAVDWTWASPLPHAASATARVDKSLHAETGHDYLRTWRPTVGFLPFSAVEVTDPGLVFVSRCPWGTDWRGAPVMDPGRETFERLG